MNQSEIEKKITKEKHINQGLIRLDNWRDSTYKSDNI